MKALQLAQWQQSTVDPYKTLMAYRTWLLARCKHLLTRSNPHFPASETLAHVGIFETHVALTLHELLSTLNESAGDRTIQVCWEALVCTQNSLTPSIESLPLSEKSTSDQTSMAPTEVATDEEQFMDHGLTASQVAIEPSDLCQEPNEFVEPPVPKSEVFPLQGHLAIPPKGHASVQIMCAGVLEEAVNFKIDGTPTVDQLQEAEMGLRGHKRKAAYVFEDGNEVLSNEIVQAGSSYILDFGHSVDHSQTIVVTSPAESSDTPSVTAFPTSEARCGSMSGLDPFSASGEVDATVEPLGKLTGPGYLNIQPPVVTSFMQVSSLLSQYTSVHSRLQSLECQQGIWGDDEIRWHLYRLQHQNAEKVKSFVIEPLAVHGCFQTGNFRSLMQWVVVNHKMNSIYITAVLHDQHWYPVLLTVNWKGVQATTWDVPQASHSGLQAFVQCVAETLGLPLLETFQLERRFAGHQWCGALSIAFLEHRIAQTNLSETGPLAESHHAYLRKMFAEAVAKAEVTWRPWMWGAGVSDAGVEQAVTLLTPMLVSHGVPTDSAHHRAQNAVKMIGAQDVIKACQGKSAWKSLKTLGTNMKFQFITPEELQAQIDKRAGKGAIGKPQKKSKHGQHSEAPNIVALDPSKLVLPEGSFTGGGKSLSQIPVTMLGPMAEGIVIVNWQQAEPYVRAAQVIAQGPLALLILQGPSGQAVSSLPITQVTVPARCLVNNEPLLLEASLVQLGSVLVAKSQVAAPVEIDTVQVATLKLTLFRDEILDTWENVSGAPLKYIIKSIPLLRLCRSENCGCPCWHNDEKINTSDAIIDVWRRQFLRAGYKPEPVASAVMFSVCVRIPQCLLVRILSCSGEAGIYTEPRTMDSREVSRDFEVIWVPKADKASVSHIRQMNPASVGVARLGDRFGIRVAPQAHSSRCSVSLHRDSATVHGRTHPLWDRS